MRVETLGCDLTKKRLQYQQAVMDCAVAALFLQFFVHGMTYLMAPGYMTPFLYHPVARTIALSLLAWSIIGWLFAWYVPIGSRVKFGAVVGTALMLCTVPLLVLPMIGPSTTGIMQAMGPVIADRNF